MRHPRMYNTRFSSRSSRRSYSRLHLGIWDNSSLSIPMISGGKRHGRSLLRHWKSHGTISFYMCVYIWHPSACYWALLKAAILLAVNVSYLAVPTIWPSDDSGNGNLSNNDVTVGKVASLASIVLSIGCIVIGLLLVSEDHIDPKVQGEAVRAFPMWCGCVRMSLWSFK